MEFSKRIGRVPAFKSIQLDGMDRELVNKLWNVIHIYVFRSHDTVHESIARVIGPNLWHNFYKLPIDNIPSGYHMKSWIKNRFFKDDWLRAYDFLEFWLRDWGATIIVDREGYVRSCNTVLEEESSGYRFVNDKLAPITNEHELGELEAAIHNTSSFSAFRGANIHLNKALEKLSDRVAPDYRNSIKESVSAIESLAKAISQKEKDSLGSALDRIKDKIKLHGALEKGFKQLYGYTSDSDGIRHALTEASTCDFEDAKYMLVSCSAFINYLIAKAQKAGISIA